MQRRRAKRSKARKFLDSEFAKPLGAFVMLGLLWISFKIGLLEWVASIPIRILAGEFK